MESKTAWLTHLLGRSLLNDQQHNEMRQRSSLMAIWVGMFCALGGFLYGYDTGIINSLLSMEFVKRTFASNGDSFSLTETSILTAILSLGTFVGALLAPLTSDSLGRRMTIIFSTALVFPLGTLLQLAATHIPLFCVGRFITGVAVGFISGVVPVYQSEASPKWVRGAVVSTYQWAITWGLLVSSLVAQGTHSINDARSYRVPIGLQMVWTCILAVGMYLLPESPRYYVRKDDLNSALNALSRLRRLPPTNEELIEELVEVKAQHDYELSFGKATLIDCFRSSPSRHKQLLRMVTGMGLQCLQQSTGINFIFYYGVNFFVGSGLSNSYIMSLVTYLVNVVATIPGILLVETIGRRKLLLFGAVGMTVSNLIIAIVGVTTNSIVANKVMIAFVCVFIASFASTWGPIVWVVCSEVYSLEIRGIAVSITAAMNWLVNFAFAFITPYLIDTGNHTASLGTKVFFIWGGCCFAGLIFSYFCVYETKGLMLEEVDEMYRCCNVASKSALYKNIIHERYMNHELGFQLKDEQDLEGKTPEDSSASPSNTTFENNHNNTHNVHTWDGGDSIDNNQFANKVITNNSQHNSNPSDILANLQAVDRSGFVPDLDFTNFNDANYADSNHDTLFAINATRSPPSLDSLSYLNNSSSSSNNENASTDLDFDEYDQHGYNSGHTRYNYANEEDLMNFINSLSRDPLRENSNNNNNNVDNTTIAGDQHSSSGGSDTIHRDSNSSTSSRTNLSQLSQRLQRQFQQQQQQGQSSSSMGYTFNNNPVDIPFPSSSQPKDSNNKNVKRATDYNDILNSLNLKSSSMNLSLIMSPLRHLEDPTDDDWSDESEIEFESSSEEEREVE